MSLSTKELNRLPKDGKTQTIEENSSLFARSGLKRSQRTRVFGKSRIGNNGKLYEVTLGLWGKDFKKKEEILIKWETLKDWGEIENRKLTEYGKKTKIKAKSLEDIFKEYIQTNPENCKENVLYTNKNRLDQILKLLPEGILVNEFSGEKGRKLIYDFALKPKVNENKKVQAKRFKILLRQVFEWALDECGSLESASYLPNLERKFAFEKNIIKSPRPHLKWKEFTNEFIPDLNERGNDLVGYSVKASVLMLSRVSSIVRLQWNWIEIVNDIECFVIPPETKGLKRRKTKIDKGNALPHHIPITSEMKKLLKKIRKITGNQKYIFWSPNKSEHLTEETPNGRLKQMGYQGRQCIHGFRHVATTAGGDFGSLDRQMISKAIGQLDQSGSIGNYDESLRLKERKKVLQWWNKELVNQGLEV